MPTTKELIEQAQSLPLEDRAFLVDSLLRTLNQPDAEIDRQWAEVAERRMGRRRLAAARP
ncbi:addiction module protein [Candidatus Sumerlaeota bacterium]